MEGEGSVGTTLREEQAKFKKEKKVRILGFSVINEEKNPHM